MLQEHILVALFTATEYSQKTKMLSFNGKAQSSYIIFYMKLYFESGTASRNFRYPTYSPLRNDMSGNALLLKCLQLYLYYISFSRTTSEITIIHIMHIKKILIEKQYRSIRNSGNLIRWHSNLIQLTSAIGITHRLTERLVKRIN